MVCTNNNEIDVLSITIGEFPIALKFDNPEFLDDNKEVFVNFISENEDHSINIEVEYVKNFNTFDPPLETPKISIDSLNRTCDMLGNGFEGEFLMDKMEGRVKSGHHVGINSFLRIVFSMILLKEKGFIAHASSLIRDGKGYIFPGKSGAGKTTITRLTPDGTLLTDEVSLVRKVNGKFRAYGTPFWGELAIGGENTSAPLNKIFFPVKDDKNYVKELKTLKALEMILPNVIFYICNEDMERKLFELCYEFVCDVSPNELHFLPEPAFWRHIDAG